MSSVVYTGEPGVNSPDIVADPREDMEYARKKRNFALRCGLPKTDEQWIEGTY